MPKVSFSHVHLYCDRVKELAEYKKLEAKLNAFGKAVSPKGDLEVFRAGADIAKGRASWLELGKEHGDPITGECDPAKFVSQKQDVVEQMLVGLGWRVTGECKGTDTSTFLISSPDASGVKFVITAHNTQTMAELGGQTPAKRARTEAKANNPDHFAASHLARFSKHRACREGVAVLGFNTVAGGVDEILAKYKELHPKLLMGDSAHTYGNVKVLDVYAYYKGDKCVSDVDYGTVLRFVEGAEILPGVTTVEASFDGITLPAYCDHWVSNVVSRTGFMSTLNDTLGFTPKVDFNAGVVAAGEAQIESTVTGNDPGVFIADETMALKDQSQVYLPINNALSEVGHVHLYLKEIGQGIQHIASRVRDLPTLVQRANDFRKMTGAGLTFLTIPRSYYGALTVRYLSKEANIEASVAEGHIQALKKAGIVDKTDIVDFDATPERITAALPAGTDKAIVDVVLRSRYGNLHMMLRDHLSEETYLRIVRNNILVDVQGDDLLMQIFTSTVLQREAGQEAPFLEFIQRVCSEKKDASGKPRPMKPGCGGFGIRNFLTLFLSIEVSKASKNRAEAELAGKKEAAAYYQSMVDAFTAQLDESNPVLTGISDAMTAEGEALEAGDKTAAAKHTAEKNKGQQKLMEISTKYKNMMRSLRQNAPAGI